MALAISDASASIGTAEFSLPNASTSLTAQTDDCILQVFIDLLNMVAGDEYEIRIYEVVNGQTKKDIFPPVHLVGAQSLHWVSPALFMGNGWDVTVKRIAGSDRTIHWSLRKVT